MSNSEKLYIVGHPVSHSKSPVMYNAVYKKLGLDWKYGFKDIAAEDDAYEFLANGDFLSVNITTPCKPAAFKASDIKAASALLAKGVNLIVCKNGRRLGYNVDGQGCVAFLERNGVDFYDKRVVVCGTGPTSLAILHSCVEAGAANVLLLGRDKNKARDVLQAYIDEYCQLASSAISLPSPGTGHMDFAEAFEHAEFRYGSYETSTKAISSADVIIDATVLGMKPNDPAPFDTSLLNASQTVLDTVYGHGLSALVSAARDEGCAVYDGSGMLVAQAALSATIVCEVANINIDGGFNWLFDIMADAAGFKFDK